MVVLALVCFAWDVITYPLYWRPLKTLFGLILFSVLTGTGTTVATVLTNRILLQWIVVPLCLGVALYSIFAPPRNPQPVAAQPTTVIQPMILTAATHERSVTVARATRSGSVGECCICCNSLTPGVTRVRCTANRDHAVCQDCFLKFAKSAGEQGAVGKTKNEDGFLLCPVPGCDACYNHLTFKEHGELFTAADKLRIDTHREHAAADARHDSQMEAEREIKRRMDATGIHWQSPDQLAADVLRRRIIDDALTTKCPRCKTAFLDCIDCFAIRCGVQTCKASFCGWCLLDCQNDAHPHVRVCPKSKSPGNLYGHNDPVRAAELFMQSNRERAETEIARLLSEQKPEVGRLTVQLLARELADLGINLRNM
eukprot:GDKI01043531.1.p1 GENE.GDKI01043531.1~~GDKI01043531.1.p1  ORF type:complete len:369 (-),score=33.92 GDKI01043531.1:121-1227(-)